MFNLSAPPPCLHPLSSCVLSSWIFTTWGVCLSRVSRAWMPVYSPFLCVWRVSPKLSFRLGGKHVSSSEDRDKTGGSRQINRLDWSCVGWGVKWSHGKRQIPTVPELAIHCSHDLWVYYFANSGVVGLSLDNRLPLLWLRVGWRNGVAKLISLYIESSSTHLNNTTLAISIPTPSNQISLIAYHT